MIKIQKILVATDFSEHAAVALRYAEEFSKAFGSEVLLCHVVSDAGMLSHIPPGGESYFPPDIEEFHRESAEKQCAELLAASSIENHSTHILNGKPFAEVVRLARREDVDLVIVGTHGHGAIAHMLLGSVAERIVRKAPCPVLTVREGEHEFVMP